MKLLLIVNPAASSVTPRVRLVIERALTSGHDTTVVETTDRGHATDLAQQAVKDGLDAVAVLSGDGTVNEVANALAGTETALAALPGGSTNVFCRSSRMTNDPVEATGILLHLLANDEPRKIGLGSANGRYFLMNVGIGFDAAVVERVERKSWLKRYAGHPYFVLAGVLQWGNTAMQRDAKFFVNFDDGSSVQSFLTVCLNANPYTYVGNLPFDISPEADFLHGLASVSVKHKALPTILGVLITALKSGRRISSNKSVDYRSNLQSAKVHSEVAFPVQVDGEYLGEMNSLELKHHLNILKVYAPFDDDAAPDNPIDLL